MGVKMKRLQVCFKISSKQNKDKRLDKYQPTFTNDLSLEVLVITCDEGNS